jgi:hypothetical protein
VPSGRSDAANAIWAELAGPAGLAELAELVESAGLAGPAELMVDQAEPTEVVVKVVETGTGCLPEAQH